MIAVGLPTSEHDPPGHGSTRFLSRNPLPPNERPRIPFSASQHFQKQSRMPAGAKLEGRGKTNHSRN
jgi:hypothetical protein